MTSPAPQQLAGKEPAFGFIGWGAESAAMLAALQERYPQIAETAAVLAPGQAQGPLQRAIPTLEGLFAAADIIFAEGGTEFLEPHLPMMRLAISDRHILVLLGGGWSVEALLEHLRERKLARCMLLPTKPGTLGTLAYYAAPFFSPQEQEALRSLFGHLSLCVELKEEAHFEVLRGLADFAPAAFYTIIEAMADGVVMMGFSRVAAVKFLASLLDGAARRMLEEDASPAMLREQAMEMDVAAAGLIELESAGIRGTIMRAIQRAVRHPRTAIPIAPTRGPE